MVLSVLTSIVVEYLEKLFKPLLIMLLLSMIYSKIPFFHPLLFVEYTTVDQYMARLQAVGVIILTFTMF